MDSLQSLDQLKAAGIEEKQARALVAVIKTSIENVATKHDLDIVKKDVDNLKIDMNIVKKDVHTISGKLDMLNRTIYGILGMVAVNIGLALLHHPFS